MRIIKFRAWDTKRKIMIGSDYSDNWEDEWDEVYDLVERTDLASIEGIASNDRYHVMQYTNLKDKNGKEIYEGDILQNLHGDIDVIEWNEGLASWQFKDYTTGFGKLRIQDWEWKVIGNIHENFESEYAI